MSLRITLQTLKKGSLSVHKYIRRMKGIFDALVFSGQSIVEDELVNYIIKGLGPEFEPIVIRIMTKIDGSVEKLTLLELKLILQKYENKLSKFPYDFSLSSVNLVNQHAKRFSGATNVGSSFMRGGESGQFSKVDASNVTISGRSLEQRGVRSIGPGIRYPVQGRGRDRFGNKSRVICQLCGKPGHVVLQCYHKFDITYMGHS